MQLFCPVDFVRLVVHILLCGLQKTELEVRKIVVLINTIKGNVSSEHGVEIVVLAVIQSKEIFGRVTKSMKCDKNQNL